ncbi:hypothetical protein ACFPRL_25415 [Pseudoclavibacter helvolus]
MLAVAVGLLAERLTVLLRVLAVLRLRLPVAGLAKLSLAGLVRAIRGLPVLRLASLLRLLRVLGAVRVRHGVLLSRRQACRC